MVGLVSKSKLAICGIVLWPVIADDDFEGLRQKLIHDVNVFIQRTCCSHGSIFHTVIHNQLTRINRNRWHPHPSSMTDTRWPFRYQCNLNMLRTSLKQTSSRKFSNKLRTKRIPEEEFYHNFTLLSSNMDRHNL